jgi:DNA helicase-2/ATP-dependent DNA helicase PcrA
MVTEFTDQQKDIINETTNLVVIAKPGSGKTTTISYKAAKIIKDLKDFQGVIAISFTNKASNELKEKILRQCDSIKGSFFGTIDDFCLNEIIYPFGRHIFHCIPNGESKISFLNGVNEEERKELENALKSAAINDVAYEILKRYYQNNTVIMELNGLLANYIMENSIGCKRYFKCKYSHIFIDEYQDCDIYQNEIFKKIINMEIIGNAVGDPEQSIFRFAGKDSKFLTSLATEPGFKTLPLDINHRSHPSIVAYSMKFLNPENVIDDSQEKRVKLIVVKGAEQQIAEVIDQKYVPALKKAFKIDKNNRIAILVTNNRTAELIKRFFTVNKLRYIMTTPLDESISFLDKIFIEILKYILDENYMFYDFKNNINLYEQKTKSIG